MVEKQDNDLTFFHSFWSKPMFELNRWNNGVTFYKNLWYFAASLLQVKKLFPDCKFNIHCDSFSLPYFMKMPYDKFFIDLDKNTCPVNLWASGKMIALENEQLGAIHIDGDVVLEDGLIVDLINEYRTGKYDIIVQNCEDPYTKEYELLNKEWGEDYINKYLRSKYASFCCGTIGINNKKLKKSYLDCYKYFVTKFLQIPNLDFIFKENNINFDLVFEQGLLYKLFEQNQYKPLLIFNKLLEDYKVGTVEKDVEKAGYFHYIFQRKYEEESLNKIKEIVKKNDIKLYNYLNSLIKL